jgi:hypothetical protein
MESLVQEHASTNSENGTVPNPETIQYNTPFCLSQIQYRILPEISLLALVFRNRPSPPFVLALPMNYKYFMGSLCLLLNDEIVPSCVHLILALAQITTSTLDLPNRLLPRSCTRAAHQM